MDFVNYVSCFPSSTFLEKYKTRNCVSKLLEPFDSQIKHTLMYYKHIYAKSLRNQWELFSFGCIIVDKIFLEKSEKKILLCNHSDAPITEIVECIRNSSVIACQILEG